MTDSRWEKLQALFAEATSLPASARAEFLRDACGEDDALYRELLAILQADDVNKQTSDDYFNVRDFIDPDKALENERIDSWQLIRRIGVGGMGSVFLATRADGSFEQTVALKVVKKGMDTESVIRRFQTERQILARLEHPHIARVIDGGITEDGRPYFVMEYVDGLPIVEYCDQHCLGVRERLALFRSVCDAVHHAHQSLVVHRDLKPSNILVTADGTPKLLDFGIAKLLDEPDEHHRTRTGMLMLTPAYASPEQLQNQSVTTQTDVYALGVILYELLSGRRPFEVGRSAEEMKKLILDSDPLRPSTALTQQPLRRDGDAITTVEQVSKARGLRADGLRRRIEGDLDTICLKALRKEPAMRYASANQMATDIERHVQGLPVIARPDSVGYRISKFVQRNRAAVAAGVLVTVTFMTLVAFYTARLAEQRDVALGEQRKSAEVVRFVTGLFEVSDPSESRGEEISARDLLDQGARDIQSRLAGQPEVQATLMRVLGEVYYSLGAAEQAEELLNDALQRLESLYGPESVDVATAKLALGLVIQDRGEIDEADAYYRESLRVRRLLLGYEHPDVAEAISVRAFLEETNGNYEEAERLHTEALNLTRALFPGDSEWVAAAMTKLAGLYRIMDRSAEAEPLLREALAMQDRIHGGEHPDSADTKRQLAGLLRNTRRFEESKALYLDVIESRVRMLGPDHLEVAHTWNSYSQLLADMGDLDGAVAANRTFIDMMERIWNGPHASFGAAYNNLAILLRDQGDLDGAAEYYQLSIDMQDAIDMPMDHPNRTFPMSGLAEIFRRQGRVAEAAPIFRDMLELRRANFGENHRLVSESKNNLAAALIGLEQFEEAEALLIDAYNTLSTDRQPDDPRIRYAARLLTELYEKTGQEADAARFRSIAGDEE